LLFIGKFAKADAMSRKITDQVVMMGNARSHQSKKTKNLIKFVGCKLIFLSHYTHQMETQDK
jgi:transposase